MPGPILTPSSALDCAGELLTQIQNGNWDASCRALAEMHTRDAVAVALLLSNVLTPADRAKLVRLVAL